MLLRGHQMGLVLHLVVKTGLLGYGAIKLILEIAIGWKTIPTFWHPLGFRH